MKEMKKNQNLPLPRRLRWSNANDRGVCLTYASLTKYMISVYGWQLYIFLYSPGEWDDLIFFPEESDEKICGCHSGDWGCCGTRCCEHGCCCRIRRFCEVFVCGFKVWYRTASSDIRKKKAKGSTLVNETFVGVPVNDDNEEEEEILRKLAEHKVFLRQYVSPGLKILPCVIGNPIITPLVWEQEALLRMAEIDNDRRQLVVACFNCSVYMNPFAIFVDHDLKAVIIMIRGTIEVADCVTDVQCQTVPLADKDGNPLDFLKGYPIDQAVRDLGLKPENEFAHQGFLFSARNLYNELETLDVLDALLGDKDPPEIISKDIDCKNISIAKGYRLVVSGQSLGAGTAAVLSLMLRPRYPTLKSMLFCCPKTFSKPLADACNLFTTSVLMGNDMMARLGYFSVRNLRDRIIEKLTEYSKSKCQLWCDSACGKDANRHISKKVLEISKKRQIMERKNQDMKCVISDIDLIIHRLYTPGNLLHLIERPLKQNRRKRARTTWCSEVRKLALCRGQIFGLNNKRCYRFFCTPQPVRYDPWWIEKEDLHELRVSLVMLDDHLPGKVCDALCDIAEDIHNWHLAVREGDDTKIEEEKGAEGEYQHHSSTIEERIDLLLRADRIDYIKRKIGGKLSERQERKKRMKEAEKNQNESKKKIARQMSQGAIQVDHRASLHMKGEIQLRRMPSQTELLFGKIRIFLCTGADNDEKRKRYVTAFTAAKLPEPIFLPVFDYKRTNQDVLRMKLVDSLQHQSIVITSPRAAEYLNEICQQLRKEEKNKGSFWWDADDVHCYVVGNATYAAISDKQLRKKCKGYETGNSSDLADFIIKDFQKGKGDSLLFLCGESRRDTIKSKMKTANIKVEECVVYKSVENKQLSSRLQEYNGEEGIEDWFCFFSPRGVSLVLSLLPDGKKSKIFFAAIGKTTASALPVVDAIAMKPNAEALAKVLGEKIF
eukprot:g88.t1